MAFGQSRYQLERFLPFCPGGNETLEYTIVQEVVAMSGNKSGHNGGDGSSLALVVVLFILLIIIGTSFL